MKSGCTHRLSGSKYLHDEDPQRRNIHAHVVVRRWLRLGCNVRFRGDSPEKFCGGGRAYTSAILPCISSHSGIEMEPYSELSHFSYWRQLNDDNLHPSKDSGAESFQKERLFLRDSEQRLAKRKTWAATAGVVDRNVRAIIGP